MGKLGGEEERRAVTGLGIKRGGIEAMDYICDRFDGAVPARSCLCQLGSIGRCLRGCGKVEYGHLEIAADEELASHNCD